MKSEMKLMGLLGMGMLCVMFCVIGVVEPWQSALQWLLQASVLLCWAWREIWRRCALNRLTITSPLLPNLGWANRITLLRGYLIALTGGFLFQPQAENFIEWMPALLYGAAAILDRCDGFIARKSKQTTLLGAELDTVFDAFGLIVAPLLAIGYGKVHWSYLLLSFAYYVFQWGLTLRRKRGLPVYDILPSQLRRALAGFQMGFIALVLLPFIQAQQALICSVVFMIPVLFGFLVDWLIITGRIKGNESTTQDFFISLQKFSTEIFQPLLRAFVVAGLFYMAHQMHLSLAVQTPDFLLSIGLLIGASLLIMGLAGRLGAFIVLLSLGSYPIIINILSITILSCTVLLLLLGMGRFSVWQWDDVWVNRRDGT